MNFAVSWPTTSILPSVYDGVTHTQRIIMLLLDGLRHGARKPS